MDIFGGSVLSASNVDYDNATSGLTADDVQDAIDEVVASGGGDVTGPASATDNAITRFDGTTGKLIKNSTATLTDGGTLTTNAIYTDEIKDSTLATSMLIDSDGFRFTTAGTDFLYGGNKIVVGPASSTDGTIARFSGTGGDTIAESASLLASEMTMLNAGSATYTTVQHLQDVFHSAGHISGGAVTNDGAGGVNVALGEGFLRNSASNVAPVYFIKYTAVNNLALATLSLNYVGVRWNSGSPEVYADVIAPNDLTEYVLATVYRDATTGLHLTSTPHKVGDHASLMIERIKAMMYVSRETNGGAILTETGTRNIAISAGDFWIGLTQVSTTNFDSSTGATFTAYYNPPTWTDVGGQAAISNTQYDNSGTLTALGNNQYGVHWIYTGMDGDVYSLYGTGSYTLSAAEATQAPSTLPPHFEKHAILVGRIIIKKDATTFTSVESAFSTDFVLASAAVNQVNGTPVDNEIARFDSNGNTIQGSGVTMDDNGYINVGVNTNVCIGNAKAILTGADNVIVGRTATNMSLGASNVLIGNEAGDGIATGTDNICIGDSVDVGNGSNRIAIGSTAEVTADYEMAIGGPTTTWRIDKVRPGRDGECDLGDADHQFKDLHLGGALITASQVPDGSVVGAFGWDADYFYICTSSGIVQSIALSLANAWVSVNMTGYTTPATPGTNNTVTYSTLQSASFPGWELFNSNVSGSGSTWHTATGTGYDMSGVAAYSGTQGKTGITDKGDWCVIDRGQNYTVSGYELTGRPDSNNGQPIDWDIIYSTDGTTYSSAERVTGATVTTALTYTSSFTPISARYWGIQVSKANNNLLLLAYLNFN